MAAYADGKRQCLRRLSYAATLVNEHTKTNI